MRNNKPRFTRTARLAVKTFKEHGITRLPVNPMDIIAQHKNWATMTYDDFASIKGWDTEDVIRKTGSFDGCAIYDSNADLYLILYNDHPLWIDNSRRITWTLMHEIGHIILDHLKETGEAAITRGELSKSKYEQFEAEAEYFAACVLSPIPVLYRLGIDTYEQIMQICGISKLAAQNRLTHLKKRIKQKRIFADDIEVSAIFHDFTFQKHCLICGFGFISKKAKCCPICGNKLIWGEGTMIYNDGYALDENGKAKICPRCKNEEPELGDYCSICGAYLINECTDIIGFDYNGNEYIEKEGCHSIAAGNARYCTICGNPTTFFRAGFLLPWEEAKEMIELSDGFDTTASEEAAAAEDDNEVPF